MTKVPIHEKIEWVPFVLSEVSITWWVEENGDDTMELEIDVEDLLNKRKLESDRIEFKTGWNPDDIYHSVCAFANDYNNDGGGYIVVGVEEENGVAKRPV